MENDTTTGKRIAEFLKSACAILFIILAALQFMGVLGKGAVYARRLLWITAALLQAYQLWKDKERGLAIIFVVFAVIFLFPFVIFLIQRII